MKAIGFSNKYYTLWEVSTETKYRTVNHKHYACGVNTQYTYIQNLSMDLDKAAEKAKELGCKDLTPDTELHGKSQSFTKYVPNDYGVGYFNGGKYEGTLISECDDLDYLLWSNNSGYGNTEIVNRIAEISSDYVVVDGKLVSSNKLAFDEMIKRVESGEFELTSTSNFSYPYDGMTEVKVKVNGDSKEAELINSQFPYGMPVRIIADSLNLTENEYKGYSYYVPVGFKSFKNQVFRVKNNQIVYQ